MLPEKRIVARNGMNLNCCISEAKVLQITVTEQEIAFFRMKKGDIFLNSC